MLSNSLNSVDADGILANSIYASSTTINALFFLSLANFLISFNSITFPTGLLGVHKK
ncbi:hypothetical protein FACS189459_3450 [Bacilli bacterium]|nr:hypothetical protein FACS189459_3450 [Bacilli bacterium]